MTISTEQAERLDTMLSALEADMGALSDWEKGFIGDQVKRFREYRENMYLSLKQFAKIKAIYDATIGLEAENTLEDDDEEIDNEPGGEDDYDEERDT